MGMTQCKDCDKQISARATRCRSCAAKKRCEDPKVRARFSEQMAKTNKQLWQDPEFRAMRSEKAKQQWEDPKFRLRRKQMWENPEFRARISENASKQLKQQWEDPEFRAKMSEKAKQQWENPEFRTMMSEQMSKTAKQVWENPDYRARKIAQTSEWSKQQWQDPEYRASISRQASEQMKRQWEDPERRARMSGENNPNWRGGTSFEPYGMGWTEELREAVRKRDDYTCAISGDVWQEGQEKFPVHHKDYDKTNNDLDNLITLSLSHHARTNFNRRHWQVLLTPIAKGMEMRTNAFVDGI